MYIGKAVGSGGGGGGCKNVKFLFLHTLLVHANDYISEVKLEEGLYPGEDWKYMFSFIGGPVNSWGGGWGEGLGL